MGNFVEVTVRIIVIGVGATAVMDLWLAVLKRLKIPTLNFALLGRWVGHLFHGKCFHEGIAKAQPIRRELMIGWLAHYAIGICFAGLLAAIAGVSWMSEPTFIPALSTGVATVIAPLFIMQPAMGSGIASSKTAAPVRNCIKSIVNHAVFGCGLYVAAMALQWI
jgi:hypothetical protein